MNSQIESSQYQQVMQLCHGGDRTAISRMVEDQLAVVQGRERAFWLLVRANQRARDALVTHLLDAAWADLEEALRIAPDDPSNRSEALAAAFNICLLTERSDQFLPVIKGLRHCYHLIDPQGLFWQYMGMMHMKRRRWHQAARAFDRAVAEFSQMEPLHQRMYGCQLAQCHAWRGISLIACHRVAEAAGEVARSVTLAERHSPQDLNHVVFAMAQAELALHEGQLQEARSALQQGIMRDAMSKRPKPAPAQQAETELLAARIARAEGNGIGFAYFCDKALTICEQHKLPLTEARVRAVMAGAAN